MVFYKFPQGIMPSISGGLPLQGTSRQALADRDNPQPQYVVKDENWGERPLVLQFSV